MGERLAVPVLINGAVRRVRDIAGSEDTFACLDANGVMCVDPPLIRRASCIASCISFPLLFLCLFLPASC